MWVFFALLFPFCFTVVAVLDSYCVKKVFDRPWMGAITSSISSTLALTLIPAAWPFAVWRQPGLKVIALALLAGALLQLSQALYFQSLAYSEAGIISAYLNLVPVILPVISYFILGQAFGTLTYIGITLNIASSVWMCLIDSNFEARWKAFFMMTAASFLYAIAVLIEKRIFDQVPVLQGFLLITTGIIISGSAPLLSTNVRRVFRNNMNALRPAIVTIAGIEVINLLAIYFRHRAVSLGNPSLIEAVATIQPTYTFALSYGLCFVAPRFGDPQAKEKLWLKLTLTAVMVAGVMLVSVN